MDSSIQRALNDRVYERRKAGALEVEKLIRDCIAARKWDKISKIVDQLVHDFAYAIHLPYARNGGLIGLAAASIALGPEVIRYVREIVPPVLACFSDQDARVRYYACESMYNIAKTTKGEILPYFNQLFDALSKLAADQELSVKNGSELLDRLLKDIIATSATTYISILPPEPGAKEYVDGEPIVDGVTRPSVAFSLPRLIPLLEERIQVLNPHTRMFLVEWLTLLDSIPDLYLVTYLPAFLKGLFMFLNDHNPDVVTATQHILERFLNEIKLIAKVKQDILERRRERLDDVAGNSSMESRSEHSNAIEDDDPEHTDHERSEAENGVEEAIKDHDNDDDDDDDAEDGTFNEPLEEWIPGQDVPVDHSKILSIIIGVLGDSPEEHIQLTALKWIDTFFDICASDIMVCGPDLLTQVLPALSSPILQVRHAAEKVNSSLMAYVASLPDDETENEMAALDPKNQTANPTHLAPPKPTDGPQEPTGSEKREPSKTRGDHSIPYSGENDNASRSNYCPPPALDYEGCVSSLTMQFLDEHEATRVASLSWLIMLQRKAPKRVLAAHDGTFPALLKTLSDTSDAVVTRDLQLLSQISQHSDDAFFTNFMINLLKLFCTDKQLLQTRGNLIIRQLCTSLSPERIYRTMADCLEKDEDTDFATTMIQNLNNNLITAPELADMRRKLRHWDAKDGQPLFVALFKAWCHNAVATLSLCLLAQAYEQAYNILQTFADIEMTVNVLIQIDKLIQLLESPVFTYLRLHLLEPAIHPHLYKTLYGILMLLPQSAAFASLKNRLNAVSSIGYLSMPTPRPSAAPTGQSGAVATSGGPAGASSAFERANRLKPAGREPSESSGSQVRWAELLDRFKNVQERSRRAKSSGGLALWNETGGGAGNGMGAQHGVAGNADLGNDGVGPGLGGHRRLLGPVEAGAKGKLGSRPTSAGDTIGQAGGAVTKIPALAERWEANSATRDGNGNAGGGGGRDGKDGQASAQQTTTTTTGTSQGVNRSRFSATHFGRKFVGGGTKDKDGKGADGKGRS